MAIDQDPLLSKLVDVEEEPLKHAEVDEKTLRLMNTAIADIKERITKELSICAQANRTLHARVEELEEGLMTAIHANEMVLAQIQGGNDMSEEQVAQTLNNSLAYAREVLQKGQNRGKDREGDK